MRVTVNLTPAGLSVVAATIELSRVPVVGEVVVADRRPAGERGAIYKVISVMHFPGPRGPNEVDAELRVERL